LGLSRVSPDKNGTPRDNRGNRIVDINGLSPRKKQRALEKKKDGGSYISRSTVNFDDSESNDEVMPGDKKRSKELMK